MSSTASIIKGLSNVEKVDLAAKLTQAAMSHCEFGQSVVNETSQDIARASADRAYIVFGYLLNHIIDCHEPQRFPEKHGG